MQILKQAQASSLAHNCIGTRKRQVSGTPWEVVAMGSGWVSGLLSPRYLLAPPTLALTTLRPKDNGSKLPNTHVAGSSSWGVPPVIRAESWGVKLTCHSGEKGLSLTGSCRSKAIAPPLMGHGVPPESLCQSLIPSKPQRGPSWKIGSPSM